MKKRSLFIIESPFQLLCAVEARHYFNPEEAILVIKYTREKQNNEQIDRLTQISQWTKIIRFKTYVFISLSEMLIVPYLSFLKFIGSKFDMIFIGESRNTIMQAFLANLPHNEACLLDDGNATLFVQEQLQSGKSLDSLVIRGSRFKTFSNIYYRLFNLRKNIPNLPNWFSCFEIATVQGQKLYRNSFSYLRLRHLNNQAAATDTVYFIGGNLSESGVLQPDSEFRFLKEAFNYYLEKGKSVVYCAHRRDSEIKLEKIRELHNKVQVRQSDFPLEMELILNKISVQGIASFYSTALLTMKRIFDPPECRMFIIPEPSIAEVFRKEVISIYKSYELLFEGVKLTWP